VGNDQSFTAVHVTWTRVAGINKVIEDTLQQTLSRILTPNRRVDILRDAMDAKAKGRPYVITFCGVNGTCWQPVMLTIAHPYSVLGN
jgi:signal recognition particle GTPase